MGRSEEQQTQAENTWRHRGEEKSVHHRGSAFLLLIGSERSNEVTSLEFFERKGHQLMYLVISYQQRTSQTQSVQQDVWVRGKTHEGCSGRLTTPWLRGYRGLHVQVMPVLAPAELTDGAKTQPGSASRTSPGCFCPEKHLVLICQGHHEGSESASFCFLVVPTYHGQIFMISLQYNLLNDFFQPSVGTQSSF